MLEAHQNFISNLIRLWDSVESTLRSCAGCGRNFSRIDLFCDRCWRRVDAHFLRGEQIWHRQYHLPTYCLTTWSLQNQEAIGSMIYGLKGGGNRLAVHRLCQRFAIERQQIFPPVINPVFVPAPPRRKGQRDHAYELAKQFAELWRAPVGCYLKRCSKREQKRLNRDGRAQIKLERLLGAPNPIPSEWTVIFVDDLITTGATAQAAFEALGEPDGYEVWTLACRDKLAPIATV